MSSEETAPPNHPNLPQQSEQSQENIVTEQTPTEPVTISSPDSTATTDPVNPKKQILIRFRRPVLSDGDSNAKAMTDSFETLTLSEVRQLTPQWEADVQAHLEEDAEEDFDETDEFEEVDEFEDDWEEGVNIDAEWDGDDTEEGELQNEDEDSGEEV